MKYLATLLCICQLAATAATGATPMQPDYLRCEYRVNPLGVDARKPRLSWVMQSDRRADGQTAYHVLVASTPEVLATGEGDLWDSGKVVSDRTIHVVYEGKPLASRTRCHWKVRTWDKDGNPSPWSEPAMWLTGLFNEEDWGAPWIADTYVPEKGREDHLHPTTMLRKEFGLEGAVKQATLFATGLGLYEARLNGQRVGENLLAPEWTVYEDRIQYQAYDVTDLLASGANAVGVMLSDGWYSGRFFRRAGNSRRVFKGQRAFRMRLDVELADGKTVTIGTDPTWRATDEGPFRICSLYDGDFYDARKEMPGWDKPGLDDASWGATRVVTFPGTKLVWQPNEPIKVTRELRPVKLTEPEDGVYLFDMGQNMVGWCRFTIRGCPAGREVALRHCERLNENGTAYFANLRSAKQRDVYVCSGEDDVTFEPKFTYHGFRYVEVRGLEEKPHIGDLVGRAFNSSAPEVGKFKCSNELVNQLMHNAFWSQLGNLTSTPTDCPQRDERAGWMGDIQAFSQTAIFNMDMAAFFTKWLADVRDSQADNGAFSDVSPQHRDGKRRFMAPAWADAGVFVPWRVYQNYADTRLLEEHIEAARRYIDLIHEHNPDLLWTKEKGSDYSDWLNGDRVRLDGFPATGNAVPKDVLSTAFWYKSTRMLANMYVALGRFEEANTYTDLADGIRKAFNAHYVEEDGRIQGDTQAGYALALRFGLLDEAKQEQAVGHLLEAIARYNGHLSTGIQTTHRAMLELSRHGHHDEACRIVNLRSVPSWGYTIDMGATTIWERWDGYVEGRGFQSAGMNSFNHWALGSVGEWIWRNVGGFNPHDEYPGWKRFVIAPRPCEGVTWARAEYDSIRGPIRSDWRVAKGRITLKVTVPPNTSAIVRVPTDDADSVKESGHPAGKADGVAFIRGEEGAALFDVSSGSYVFEADLSD